MSISRIVAIAAVSVFCAACSTPSQKSAGPGAATPSASQPQKNARAVKSRDGSFTGEMIGTPAAGSRFAKLQIGMTMNEVQDVLGRSPDRTHSYESGKRWIPFYFGNDARRLQALYKGEGCLIATGGNAWGGGGGELIQIEVDPSGTCYQP